MMEVRLLGCIEVDIDGSGIRLSAAKARWLFAFLALHVGRSRSVESIIDALWGGVPTIVGTEPRAGLRFRSTQGHGP